MVFAGMSAALAFNGSLSAACNSFRTCYYADINLSPSGQNNDVLNISGLNQNWQNIGDPILICGGIFTGTWNDCASSVLSRRTSTTEYAWTDSFCHGSRLVITPGEVLNYVGNTFNDKISSDRDNNGGSSC